MTSDDLGGKIQCVCVTFSIKSYPATVGVVGVRTPQVSVGRLTGWSV